MSVFKYLDYKAFVRETLENLGIQQKGIRSRAAEAMGCHTAYVSQVLNGSAHFSLEQLVHLNEFLGLSPDEGYFALLLLQLARAGTDNLRKIFKDKIDEILKKRLDLANRIGAADKIPWVDQSEYYGHWYYLAIHAACAIGTATKDSIALGLGLPVATVSKVLEFLLSRGLIEQGPSETYAVGSRTIHLEAASPLVPKHHSNWRIQALNSLDVPAAEDLHYSAVISIKEEDALKLKEILLAAIEKCRGVNRASEPEALFCYSLDLFALQKS